MTTRLRPRSLTPCAVMLGAVLAFSVLADAHDDHGDGPRTATILELGSPMAGTLGAGDVDVFRLDLVGQTRVRVRTSGPTDTTGELADSAGTRLAMDEDAGAGGNFSITQDLGRGVYYIHVSGSEGAYAIDAIAVVDAADQHGDTPESSTLLRLLSEDDLAAVSPRILLSTSGSISPVGDVDVFRLDVPYDGTRVAVRATGTAAANASLVDSDDVEVASDVGAANFDFSVTLAAGIYYLKVSAEARGNYRVLAQHSGVDAPDVVDSDGDGIADGEDPDRDGDGVVNAEDAFPDDAAESADADANGIGDNAHPIAVLYDYDGTFEEGSSVSYSGQTARHLLMLGLVEEMAGLTEDVGMEETVRDRLRFYMTGEGADDVPHGFTMAGGEAVIPGPNYGDVSRNKNLWGKIAGGDGQGGGETSRLIGNEFFGWDEGLAAGARPVDLAWLYIDRLATESTDGNAPQIPTVDGMVSLDAVQVDAHGRDYRQLMQKFLGGAVAFSQGTNDYFQTSWPDTLTREGDDNFTAAEHDFDEAFGYYGAARNINDYTDDEAAAKGGREGWQYGYHDSNGDGSIDVRSEFVFGHAQNCAKRDLGSGGVTDYSKGAMDAFLLGRQILGNSAKAGAIGDDALLALHDQIETAAKTWEKCIAATVVHYINDVASDMGDYEPPNFADLANFKNVAKHWGEMKGFALGLQFTPHSPFRDGSVEGITLEDLREVLSLMGDAPVLADGSQGGSAADAVGKGRR